MFKPNKEVGAMDKREYLLNKAHYMLLNKPFRLAISPDFTNSHKVFKLLR